MARKEKLVPRVGLYIYVGKRGWGRIFDLYQNASTNWANSLAGKWFGWIDLQGDDRIFLSDLEAYPLEETLGPGDCIWLPE